MGPVSLHPIDDVCFDGGRNPRAFVLMKQNRMSRRADARNHLHLQIDLLAEKEITTMLQLQQHIIAHLGIPSPPGEGEIEQLAEETEVERLADELREKLPES